MSLKGRAMTIVATAATVGHDLAACPANHPPEEVPIMKSGRSIDSKGCALRSLVMADHTNFRSSPRQQSPEEEGAITANPASRAREAIHDSSGSGERTGLPNAGASGNQTRPEARHPCAAMRMASGGETLGSCHTRGEEERASNTSGLCLAATSDIVTAYRRVCTLKMCQQPHVSSRGIG